jgi:hypothetical protein
MDSRVDRSLLKRESQRAHGIEAPEAARFSQREIIQPERVQEVQYGDASNYSSYIG